MPPFPHVEAAVHLEGLAAEQVMGEHFQKARKPQLTLKQDIFDTYQDIFIRSVMARSMFGGNDFKRKADRALGCTRSSIARSLAMVA